MTSALALEMEKLVNFEVRKFLSVAVGVKYTINFAAGIVGNDLSLVDAIIKQLADGGSIGENGGGGCVYPAL